MHVRAKEYFEGIRDEVVSLRRAREMLARMRAREGLKSQSYTGSGGGGGDVDADGMGAVDKRIDFERRLTQRVADSELTIDEACSILYGPDNRGGLAKLKGTQYADAICMAYCQAEPWAEVADVMQCSTKWCRQMCDVGFRYIDAHGMACVKNA